MNKIKILLIAMLISALCGGVVIRSFFPKIKETVREIKPTVHQLDSLATQISEGFIVEIDSLQKALNAKPKTIYIDRIVEGEPVIDSVKVYPQGFIDITNSKAWKKVFENKDRGNDVIEFITVSDVRVTSYVDSAGNPYIGYDKFYSRIDSLKLMVSPEILEIEYINRFSLFINGGFIIDKSKVIKNDVLTTEYNAALTTDLGIVLDEQWLITPSLTVTQNYTSYGLKFGTYLIRMGKCKRNVNQ